MHLEPALIFIVVTGVSLMLYDHILTLPDEVRDSSLRHSCSLYLALGPVYLEVLSPSGSAPADADNRTSQGTMELCKCIVYSGAVLGLRNSIVSQYASLPSINIG